MSHGCPNCGLHIPCGPETDDYGFKRRVVSEPGAVIKTTIIEMPQELKDAISQNLALGREWSKGHAEGMSRGRLEGMHIGALIGILVCSVIAVVISSIMYWG